MEDNVRNMIVAYDRVLRTESEKKISTGFFRYTDENNEKMAIILFKHVFEDILEWTPEDVLNNASEELIKCMKLSVPYAKLRYPRELNKNTDYFYIANIVYPEKFHNVFSRQNLILNMYRNVLDKHDNKFPKDYFSSEDGELRAKICLQYAIIKEANFKNPEDLYEKFSDSDFVKVFFKRYRLDFVLAALYKNDALEYLHDSLNSKQKNVLLYAYYRFMKVFVKSKAEKSYNKLLKNAMQTDLMKNPPASYEKNQFRYWYTEFLEIFEDSEVFEMWNDLAESASSTGNAL